MAAVLASLNIARSTVRLDSWPDPHHPRQIPLVLFPPGPGSSPFVSARIVAAPAASDLLCPARLDAPAVPRSSTQPCDSRPPAGPAPNLYIFSRMLHSALPRPLVFPFLLRATACCRLGFSCSRHGCPPWPR
ncbi:hypothetical protein HPP92_014572 [Vanilla planifolia]|uniref:Uncharacterized protein n=1 Tax=Vanilla planifolia TaxID=51239 RepID=A0A835QPQ8_VANPL|nr:hypothetical protein HPP92_014572 [Vanilla planifolia]